MTKQINEYYKYILLIIFITVWAWSAYDPSSQRNWIAENNMIFIFIPIIYFVCIWFIKFSKLSLSLVTIFFLLHIIGAHYNYGSVPFGVTLGSWFTVGGNVYDKFVHFSFGFLIFYPLRELFLRLSLNRGVWSYVNPLNAVLAMAGIYEIFEWFSVLKLDPAVAYMFIGGNDPFDTTKDIFAALVGALIALTIVAILESLYLKGKFWNKLKESVDRDKRTFPKEDVILHGDII